MIQAAKATAQLFLLAAVCLPAFANIPRTPLVAEKPHLGAADFALASSDAAKQLEGKVAKSLADSGLLKGFDVTVAGRQIDAIAGKASQFVVEVTIGGGRGKISQAVAQKIVGQQ